MGLSVFLIPRTIHRSPLHGLIHACELKLQVEMQNQTLLSMFCELLNWSEVHLAEGGIPLLGT